MDPISAIGNVNSNSVANQAQVDQNEFINLFIKGLQFQDPLEAQDNSQFLAQMAQFAALNQASITNENLSTLSFMQSINQASSMLDKQVNIDSGSGPVSGRVVGVEFGQSGATLNIDVGDDKILRSIPLSQVTSIFTLSSE